jgi:membrane-bound lytic murein transglycosylase MltF
MMYRLFALGFLFCSCTPSPEGQEPAASFRGQDPSPTEAVEAHVLAERRVDFPEIRKAGTLRVGVPYSRTNFFFEKDEFRGFEFELFRELEKNLNKSRQRGEPALTVVFNLTPVANLITAVNEGKIDIAAGIVITKERQASVAFTEPYLSDINTVVISNTSAPPISSLRDLSGKPVLVNRGSSYPGHLADLGEELKKDGLAPPDVELVETLETEDIFELVNSGSIPWTIAHEHHAELWKQVLPNLRVYSDLTLGEPARFAWAVRKNNPELLKVLNGFVTSHRQGTVVGNVLLKRYYKSTQWISNPTATVDLEKVQPLIGIFKKYGEGDLHAVSWLGLAAVAFQESRFDPKLRSRAGAVGLMQIRPETAAEVGVTGIEDPEKNVQAAARYFDLLAERYFNEPHLDRNDRVAFILAGYNAGPTRIQRLRKEAREHNVDPDRWFGQMETLVLRKVGREPVHYVTNVAKYYLCLSRILLTAEERTAEGLDLQ